MYNGELCPTCGKLRKAEPSDSQSDCACRAQSDGSASNSVGSAAVAVSGSDFSDEEKRLFEYLVSTLEQKGKDGSAWFFSNHFELDVQNAVIARLEKQGWYCRSKPAGTTLDWYCSRQSPQDLEKLGEELRALRGTTYEDIVVATALIGPVVGVIYGACNGDILHGFLVGSVVGFLPALPIFILMPFMLVYEKFKKSE